MATLITLMRPDGQEEIFRRMLVKVLSLTDQGSPKVVELIPDEELIDPNENLYTIALFPEGVFLDP